MTEMYTRVHMVGYGEIWNVKSACNLECMFEEYWW
jgi:hypothetical protein